jgi:hypothetical protein
MPAVWGLGAQCSVLRLPKDLTARERRLIDGVEQNVGRIARVLAAVHDLLLAESDGELPVDPRPSDIAVLCDDAIEQLREAGIDDEIRREGEGNGEGVWDAEQLSEAISYLLECALHAGPDDAGVHLRWSGGPREIVLTIERPARPGEAQSGIDLEFGAALGAGPEDPPGRIDMRRRGQDPLRAPESRARAVDFAARPAEMEIGATAAARAA